MPHRVLPVTLGSGNVQAQAREARYDALAGWARERDLPAIATAHHADDQAETLLMRLNRGSGLAGLAGVRAESVIAGHRVRRPLLGWRKAELEGVVRDAGLTPVADPSNDVTRFDRARVRRAIGEADWLDPEALARSARLLAEAQAALDQIVEDRLATHVRELEDGVFQLAPGSADYLGVELVTRLLARMHVDAPRSAVASLCKRLQEGRNASLGGMLATPRGGVWTFRPEPPRRSR